jgi:asparagine N-glycosylation enzyme membrane subunit Stt3
MNKVDIASLLIFAAFVWAAWSVIRKPSRGNIWAVTVIGVILGLDLGFTIAWRLYIPEMRSLLSNIYTSIAIDQVQTSMVSAAALRKLEDGKNAEAQSFLAEQVARYYRELKAAKTLNAQQQKTVAIIEELSSKSEILRQKLAEQTTRPKD